MQITIVLYRNMTALDAIGPYEVLSRLPGAEITFAAPAKGQIPTDTGMLDLTATTDISEIAATDLVLVPGGPDIRAQTQDTELHQWLRDIDRTTTWTTSVCTGSVILARAGLLHGRRATTHWLAKGHLEHYDARPQDSRVVIDGKYATAAGVSAGIDLALTLAATIAGPRTAQAIQLAIEYDPQPPFQLHDIPQEVAEYLRTGGLVIN